MSVNFVVLFLVGGLAIGSFLNVCIYRLPRNESLIKPGSSCPSCHSAIKPYHNIPILSYILLRGHCAYCGTKISFIYPLIEFISMILSAVIYFQFGMSGAAVFYLYLTYFLIVIAFIDWNTSLILNKVLLALLSGGIVLNLIYHIIPWRLALIGAIAGAGTLLLIALLGKWYFKKESMGMGDVKLAGVLGFFVGWKLVLISLYSGYLLAAIYFIFLKLFKKQPINEYMPMGPFFSMSVFIWIGWWRELLDFYLKLIK